MDSSTEQRRQVAKTSQPDVSDTTSRPEELPILGKDVKQGKATANELTMNLITGGLGTGIFTLPWSTAGASVFPAVAITAAVLAVNAWTISIIVEAGERHQTFNLGALLGRLPGTMGRAAENIVNAFIWISLSLCLLSYLIVITDCLSTSMHASVGLGSSRVPFVVIAGMIVLPLCFMDQRRLSFSSTVAVLATANIFLCIFSQFLSAEQAGTTVPACYFGLSTGFVSMFSAMMQVVVIQMCVLPMYSELEDRSPAKFNRIIAVSFSALFLLCAGFAVMGYLAFGKEAHSNVLLNLPDTHWGHASRIGAAAAVAGVYPIIMNPMITPLKTSAVALRSGPGVVSAATIGVVAVTAIAAVFVMDLGAVNIFNGALSCGVFVALGPSTVGLYLLDAQRSGSAVMRAALYANAFVGLLLALLGLIFKDNYTSNLASACAWWSKTHV